MEKFAFIIHPIDARKDVSKKYPIAKYLPIRAIEWFLSKKEPETVAHITGLKSLTGSEAEGWLIACPLTPRQFLELPTEAVYAKMEKCGHIAEELGAKILGLGAFTSVVGDGGITLAKRLKIAVTTGNSYTVATAIEGAIKGAEMMAISIPEATVAVVGATGSIGATCAEILSRSVRELELIGRSTDRLNALAERIRPNARAKVTVHTDIAEGLKNADIIITVSNAAEAIIHPHHIKKGAVVCDVARPRDVSVAVAKERNDVLIIEGGLVRPPGDMKCTRYGADRPFSFGFPPGTAYACMSETMALALEGRYENFTLGKEVTVAQTDEINAICHKHGFVLDGFRSFERAVPEEEINRIRMNAGRGELNKSAQATQSPSFVRE